MTDSTSEIMSMPKKRLNGEEGIKFQINSAVFIALARNGQTTYKSSSQG